MVAWAKSWKVTFPVSLIVAPFAEKLIGKIPLLDRVYSLT